MTFYQYEGSDQDVTEWNGKLVYAVYKLSGINAPGLDIEILGTCAKRLQGLALLSEHGGLNINDETGSRFDLWSNTAPKVSSVRLVPHEDFSAMSVKIWNIWEHSWREGLFRYKFTRTEAWVGNAGMLVEWTDDSTFLLRCSDGEGDPSFDNLVVKCALQGSEVGTRVES